MKITNERIKVFGKKLGQVHIEEINNSFVSDKSFWKLFDDFLFLINQPIMKILSRMNEK